MADDVECLFSIAGCVNMVVLFQYLPHQHQQLHIVLHYQDMIGVFICSVVSLFVVIQAGYYGLEVGDGHLRYVEVDVVVLVYLPGLECILGDRNAYGEGGSYIDFTLALYVAMVQIDKVACQGQPKSVTNGLVLAVVSVIETLKEVSQALFRDAAASVGHFDDDIVEIAAHVDTQLDLSAGVGVLGCV